MRYPRMTKSKRKTPPVTPAVPAVDPGEKPLSQPAPPPEIQHRNVWGYRDTDEVAYDIIGGIHESLLSGYFVFAIRTGGNIRRLVVTRKAEDIWMYGIVTPGWSGLIPKISREGLAEMLVPEMENSKLDKEIIEDFKYYISQ